MTMRMGRNNYVTTIDRQSKLSFIPPTAVNTQPSGDKNLKILKKDTKALAHSNGKIVSFINSLPYTDASDHDIYKYGKALIKPVISALQNNQSYKQTTRWGFHLLQQLKMPWRGHQIRFTSVIGVVANYRLVIKHKQALIYLLLRDISGMGAHDHMRYVTDHLWISTAFDVQHDLRVRHNVESIGIGDTVAVFGQIHRYYGMIGKHREMKYSLGNVLIVGCGYPQTRHHHFTYAALKYDHGHQCIYYRKGDQIRLGNEATKEDKQLVSDHHLEIDNAAKVFLDRDIIAWLKSGRQYFTYWIDTYKYSGQKYLNTRYTEHNSNHQLVSRSEHLTTTEYENTAWYRLKLMFGQKIYPLILSVDNLISLKNC